MSMLVRASGVCHAQNDVFLERIWKEVHAFPSDVLMGKV